jgi:plastocyanin
MIIYIVILSLDEDHNLRSILRTLLPLFAIIGVFLVIGAVLISSGILPEENARNFNALTDISMQSDLRVIREPTIEENVYAYAINDVAVQAFAIAMTDPRVNEILENSQNLKATVTIAAIQPTLFAHRDTGELLHSSSGQLLITANWQTVEESLYSEPRTFEQIAGSKIDSYQQIWNVLVDLDEQRVTDVLQVADRTATGTVKPNVVGAANNMFMPNAIIVETGSIIRWTNPSNLQHNVVGILNQTGSEGSNNTAKEKSVITLDSGFIYPNKSWQYRFEKEGIFSYLCTIHSEEGMRGVIIVAPPRAS